MMIAIISKLVILKILSITIKKTADRQHVEHQLRHLYCEDETNEL